MCNDQRSPQSKNRGRRILRGSPPRQPQISRGDWACLIGEPIDEAAYDAWLDPGIPPAEAKALLSRNLDGEFPSRRVSRAVNSVKKQGAEWVEPVNPL